MFITGWYPALVSRLRSATRHRSDIIIPGFNITPTFDDMMKSSRENNQLLEDKDQPEISPIHFDGLRTIFIQFNAQHQFGLHLNHKHLELEQDMVMLGTRFTEPSGYWTRPTKIDAINYGNVHGHFFKLVANDDDDSYVWIAYTYYEGALSGNVSSGFFKAVAQYLGEHGLIDVLGLQVLDDLSLSMVEIVLDTGTVMLDASKARYGKPYRTTGWVLQQQDGVMVFKGNFEHVPGEDNNPSTHTTYTDGKPLPDIASLKTFLREKSII